MEKQLVYDVVQLFLGAKTTNYIKLQTHRSEGQILQTVRLEIDQSVNFQLQTLAQKCIADSLQHRQNTVQAVLMLQTQQKLNRKFAQLLQQTVYNLDHQLLQIRNADTLQ